MGLHVGAEITIVSMCGEPGVAETDPCTYSQHLGPARVTEAFEKGWMSASQSELLLRNLH